jgi:hypothetical protein
MQWPFKSFIFVRASTTVPLGSRKGLCTYADLFGDGSGTFFVLCLIVGYTTFVAFATMPIDVTLLQNTFILLWHLTEWLYYY